MAAGHLHLVEPRLVALEGAHAHLFRCFFRLVHLVILDNVLGRLQSASGWAGLGREADVLKVANLTHEFLVLYI